MLAVEGRDLAVDGPLLSGDELVAGLKFAGLFFVHLLVTERGGPRAGQEACPLKQGVQGSPVLLVGESEVAEAGQLEALRYLV